MSVLQVLKIEILLLTTVTRKRRTQHSLSPGLQAFFSHPSVLSFLNKLVGKILLMETIEPPQEDKTSRVVLYDTSQEDDININSTCLKTLQDQNMSNPLVVSSADYVSAFFFFLTKFLFLVGFEHLYHSCITSCPPSISIFLIFCVQGNLS